MNAWRGDRRGLLPGGGGGVEPPRPPTGGGRGPRRRRPGDYRGFLPFLALGAGIIAVERLAMLVFTVPDLPPAAYAGAGAVFATVVLGGVALGGTAFHRAWTADQVTRAQGPGRPPASRRAP